jgi:hypothetical protein
MKKLIILLSFFSIACGHHTSNPQPANNDAPVDEKIYDTIAPTDKPIDSSLLDRFYYDTLEVNEKKFIVKHTDSTRKYLIRAVNEAKKKEYPTIKFLKEKE